MTFGGPARTEVAQAASVAVHETTALAATDLSASRRCHPCRYRYADRPYYYAPVPLLPIPPFFGYG